MTDVPNPYGADLGNRDALEALGDTPGLVRSTVEKWTDAQFERSYAPGKWSARKVLIHLAQTELALGEIHHHGGTEGTEILLRQVRRRNY